MSLMQAVIEGDLAQVKQLIDSGENVNFQDEWGETPLFGAVNCAHPNIAQVLIQAGAKVNLKNKEHMTPLMYAVEGGHSDIVRILLESKANVNAQDDRGYSILVMGIKGVLRNGTEIVQMLLQAKPDIHLGKKMGITAVSVAIRFGLTDIVRVLIEKGADIHYPGVLFTAIDGRNPDTVRFLIQAGAGVQVHNITLIDGTTPLMWAVLKGYTEIVKILLQVGVDTEEKNNKGETALTIAIAEDRKEIIDLLRQAHL